MHSAYSRATSPKMNLENLDIWAAKKGIHLLGTTDFTHPLWQKELLTKLVRDKATGLYKLKDNSQGTLFMPTCEISSIYKKHVKCRRIHTLFFMPDLESAFKFSDELTKRGCNLRSDGRPIVGLEAKELAKIAIKVNKKALIIPAHIWTPWFSLYGSQSGFDKISDCFEEMTKHIYAVETGISASSAMCERVKELDNITLISNSDSHSLNKIGRECNVFEFDKISYDKIYNTLKNKDTKKFIKKIEFFPEEGRYHFDGHQKCQQSFHPKKSKKIKNICPKCNKPLVIGVLNRVNELSNFPEGRKPKKFIPVTKLFQLEEIIAHTLRKGVKTKTVQERYENLVKWAGSEFEILLNKTPKEVSTQVEPEIGEAIGRVRAGKVKVTPGYDGEYGKIEIFSQKELSKIKLARKQ